MPSLSRRCRSLVIDLDKHFAHLSIAKMKIRMQAPELLKKAATSLKSKTAVLRTRLLILASLRRRMALVGEVSRGIHALVSSSDGRRAKQATTKVDCYDHALMLRKAMVVVSEDDKEAVFGPGHGGMAADLSDMAVFDEHGHGFPDWTQALFDEDNCCYVADEDVEENADDHCDPDSLEEPSVIEVIRSNREVQGLEFNMDEEIDNACDMFIRRFRSRMNQSS